MRHCACAPVAMSYCITVTRQQQESADTRHLSPLAARAGIFIASLPKSTRGAGAFTAVKGKEQPSRAAASVPAPPPHYLERRSSTGNLQMGGGGKGGECPLEQAPGTAVSLCMGHQGCGSDSSQSADPGERFTTKNCWPGSGGSLKAGHKRPKAASCQRGSSVRQETPRPSAPDASGPPASERYPGDPGAHSGWAPPCHQNAALLILHARKAPCAGLVSYRRDAARCYLPPCPPACKVIRREAGKAERPVGISDVLGRGPQSPRGSIFAPYRSVAPHSLPLLPASVTIALCRLQHGPSTAAYRARGARYNIAAMQNKDGPSRWQEEHREPPALARQRLQLTSCPGLTPAGNEGPRDRSLAPPPPAGRGDNRKGKSEKTRGLKRKQFNHH